MKSKIRYSMPISLVVKKFGQNSGLEVSEAADPGKAGLDGTSREPPFPEIVEDLGPGATTSASARNLSLPSFCVNQPIR